MRVRLEPTCIARLWSSSQRTAWGTCQQWQSDSTRRLPVAFCRPGCKGWSRAQPLQWREWWRDTRDWWQRHWGRPDEAGGRTKEEQQGRREERAQEEQGRGEWERERERKLFGRPAAGCDPSSKARCQGACLMGEWPDFVQAVWLSTPCDMPLLHFAFNQVTQVPSIARKSTGLKGHVLPSLLLANISAQKCRT